MNNSEKNRDNTKESPDKNVNTEKEALKADTFSSETQNENIENHNLNDENTGNKETFFRKLKLKFTNLCKAIPVSWKFAILVFLIVRILASAVAVTGASSIKHNKVVPAEKYSKPRYKKSWEIVAGVWEKSDALWYIHIAKDGYKKRSRGVVFLPLYPLLIRGLHSATGIPWILSAIIVSNISFLLALYFLYRICEVEKDREIAEKTVWYQALYPGSLFLLAPYTEALFLALATGSFLAARTRRWWLAGIAGAFLGATRNLGVLIFIPLVIEFIRQRREEKPVAWKNAPWLLVVPLGIISVMAFHAKLTGDPLALVHNQQGWSRTFMLPWKTVWLGIKQAVDLTLQYPGGLYIMEAVVVLGVLILGVTAFFKIPLPYTVFIWLNILPPLFAPYRGRMLMSCIRFAAVLFPIFMVIALLTRSKMADQAVKIAFAAFWGISISLYVTSQGMF